MTNKLQNIPKILLLLFCLLGAGSGKLWAQTVFINEIHYDNASTDTGEAIEIAGPAGTDLTGWSLVLYNGSNGTSYNTRALSGIIPDLQNGFGAVSFSYPVNGIQNGSPDGIALVNGASVVQFISYEGSFAAVGGPADGLTSTDIGVSEAGNETAGQSLQLTGTGTAYADFTWTSPADDNFGALNTSQSFAAPQPVAFINEIHYDNDGTDAGEAIEIAGTAGLNLSGWKLLLYNGNGGAVYNTTSLSGIIPDQQNGYGTLSFSYPANGIQNGAPDGVALIDADGNVIQFLSYEGTLTATGGAANGLTSTDIGVAENASTPVDYSLQLTGTGTAYADFSWAAAKSNTFGAVNSGQTFSTDNTDPEPVFEYIYTIQGSSDVSPLAGQEVITSGIVTGDFQEEDQLKGFYIQDPDGDGNQETSDGIFVYSDIAVEAGTLVEIRGTVTEFFGLTQISNVTEIEIVNNSENKTITPTLIQLPFPAGTDTNLPFQERYEGMLVQFPQSLTVTENFNLGRFGELVLSEMNEPAGTDGRLFNPTNFIDPTDIPDEETENDENNTAAVTAQQTENNRSSIILDDNRNGERDRRGRNNPNNIPIDSPVPYLDPATGTVRIGTTIENLTGILDYGFNNYRIRPTQFNPYNPEEYAAYFNYDPRPAVPSVGDAAIKVASFNVLNYFNGNGQGGGFPTARGADNIEEFNRQQTKIIATLDSLDADIVGLIEIENDGDGEGSAIDQLVDVLNKAVGAGTYDYIRNPKVENGTGTDAIKVAFIYKPSVVMPLGPALADTASVHNRPPLAQTFKQTKGGERFTVIINHFKSKGSGTGQDADQGDGQGASNFARILQAQALLEFAKLPTTTNGDEDVMIIGDLNAYYEEDPMDILRAGGFVSLFEENSYSYVFNGQSGSLDHALITESLKKQITGAEKWHINADEPRILDYNVEFNPAFLYQENPYRSSDHDPVLVGVKLDAKRAAAHVSMKDILFSVWPNPSNGAITIASTLDAMMNSPAEVTLRSPYGEVLYTGSGDLAEMSRRVSNKLQAAPVGLYTLQIIMNNQVSTLPVLKF